MDERRDPPSRFRPPRDTPFVRALVRLLDDTPDERMPKQFIRHMVEIRRHIARATDDDLPDLVRLSVQRQLNVTSDASFDELLQLMRERRDAYRHEFDDDAGAP